jgi:hypothetical protein
MLFKYIELSINFKNGIILMVKRILKDELGRMNDEG